MCTRLSLVSFILVLVFRCIHSEIQNCTNDDICGWNSMCVKNICNCNGGFLSQSPKPTGKQGKNCIDQRCGNGKCYECIDGSKCKRCINYVMEGSGKCVDACSTTWSLKITGEYQGRVCKAEEKKSSLSDGAIIGIVVGVIIAILVLGVLLAIVFYFKISKSCRQNDEATRGSRRSSRARSSDHVQYTSTDNKSPTESKAETQPQTINDNNEQANQSAPKQDDTHVTNGRPPGERRVQYEI